MRHSDNGFLGHSSIRLPVAPFSSPIVLCPLLWTYCWGFQCTKFSFYCVGRCELVSHVLSLHHFRIGVTKAFSNFFVPGCSSCCPLLFPISPSARGCGLSTNSFVLCCMAAGRPSSTVIQSIGTMQTSNPTPTFPFRDVILRQATAELPMPLSLGMYAQGPGRGTTGIEPESGSVHKKKQSMARGRTELSKKGICSKQQICRERQSSRATQKGAVNR